MIKLDKLEKLGWQPKVDMKEMFERTISDMQNEE